ncbi:aminoglycoside phosphotransferase family protein [Yersinia intermedia]|uniref:aminoglycoside phosphotransferase family protein n=1 Tax=Yersinia intermedia TaxID=631 RepID=UPI0005E2735F|nr:aminoglycoside phosphotransferase family protein [Yersinia intermedia]WET14946.1 aminoglycoside phosphotransferase family protein [Yersinia intermedia]CNC61796.1 Aminoglycoside/hydroxyurea antibiotic resistance kinase [Yersinia intermedia]CRF13442.1 Aminoglycoside/hydroxyurea antibiotic resistance kinase [Yersinia intermedia]
MEQPTLTAGLAKLHHYFERWQLAADGAAFHTPSSWLQPVLYRNRPAMLKIAMTKDECLGAQLMVWWGGDGAARVLEQEEDAILLERISGLRSLLEMARGGQDDEASRIICHVVARLHAQDRPQRPELPTLSSQFRSLKITAKTQGGIFADAAFIAEKLLTEPQEITVLHGDIHHANILDAGPRGWLAIDPKGLIGERGFDFANIFCNPNFVVATSPGRLIRQVDIIAETAALDRCRLLAWIVAWAGLSAAWHIESEANPDTALAVANIALNALHRANSNHNN